MAQSYKALKEDFVSNLGGGTVSEINWITAVAPAAVLLWSVLQSRQAYFVHYGAEALATDFLLNVAAILLATTLYADAPLLLNLLLATPAIALYAFSRAKLPAKRISVPPSVTGSGTAVSKPEKLDAVPMRPFITAYRGSMMIVTCLAILAVDFRVFPRRFAKVENWGTSLMDIGVGSFVFSAGVVTSKSILRDRLTGRSSSIRSRLYTSVRHSAPLLVLGLVRLYSVKGLDYAEHVTEYGVHWNFFFTLALLPPFVAVSQSLSSMIPSHAILALLWASAYEVLLDLTPLKAYVLTAQRTGLFSKNREGIFSFFGYLAIFLGGQATGLYVLPRRSSPNGSPSNATAERKRLLVRLASWSLIWMSLLAFTLSYNYGLALRISRRLANLPYVLWVCAFNCSQLLAFCLVETFVFPNVHKAMDSASEQREVQLATSRVLQSYNRNGLFIFLIANLMTGLINLTLKTIEVGTVMTMTILSGYAAVLTAIALVLDAKDISIKI
ncbi:Glucosaminyl phosphatidylinositol (GlcN-PI) nositol acylation protein [Lambiella insularis]|nr:Glucosaminyl phosphatidylinositol (GlcN-PI) nositol acylation protein [Lambiella insularis]